MSQDNASGTTGNGGEWSDTPAISPKVRSVAYFIGLGIAAATFVAGGIAAIWLDGEIAAQVSQTAVLLGGGYGIISAGLSVTYRPTK